MATNIDELMDLLKEKGLKVCGTTSDFYGYPVENQGIWIAADYTPEFFDYYSVAWNNTFGVDPTINEIVEENGWYFEWYDPGTMMIWQQH